MATKLRVVSEYRSRDVVYGVGSVIEVSDEQARFLMVDAPGCFVVHVEKAIEAPPVDKMVKRPGRKKTSK